MRIFLLGLVALAACHSGITDCDNCNDDSAPACQDCSDDTGDTIAVATGSFTAPQVLLPDGSFEDCTSNLVGKKTDYTVASGATQDVVVGSYDFTLGDFNLASEASAGLPVHTASDGSTWIAAASDLTVGVDGSVAPDTQAMSRYIGGQTWTCNDAGSTDFDTAQTLIVYYVQNGTSLLIGINGGKWGIDGDTLYNPYSPNECEEMYGAFENAAQLTYYAACVDGDVEHTTNCWKGEFEDNPETW